MKKTLCKKVTSLIECNALSLTGSMLATIDMVTVKKIIKLVRDENRMRVKKCI